MADTAGRLELSRIFRSQQVKLNQLGLTSSLHQPVNMVIKQYILWSVRQYLGRLNFTVSHLFSIVLLTRRLLIMI